MQLCIIQARDMFAQALPFITIAAALGAGLVAGICFAFSSFVLPALAGMPDREGMRAMQAINARALGPYFLTVFVGTALLCALLALHEIFAGAGALAAVRMAGGATYLVGVVALTRARHLVYNDQLAATPADGAEAASFWLHYVRKWTFWNDVRWVAALVASALLWQSVR